MVTQPIHYIKKAEEAVKNSQSFFGLFVSTDKLEEAIEHYTQAGNQYKYQKEWSAAGDAFASAGDLANKIFKKNKEYDHQEVARLYSSAARCYGQYNELIEDAIINFEKAIDIYENEGNATLAGRLHQELAELYEANFEYYLSVTHYREAVNLLEIDNKGKFHVQKCMLKSADILSINLKRYVEASTLYEHIAKNNLNNKENNYILTNKAYALLFNAVICQLANGDLFGAKKMLTRFRATMSITDEYFSTSRESEYLEYLIVSIEKNDEEQFDKTVIDYHRLKPANGSTWTNQMFQRIKENMNSLM